MRIRDKTLTREDSSNKVLGYKTHLYDGNFYTGYQSWKQELDFQKLPTPTLSFLPVQLNIDVLQEIRKPAYILTSGHKEIWSFISRHLSLPFFSGPEMSAETKVIITQELQRAGKKVISYGDSMKGRYGQQIISRKGFGGIENCLNSKRQIKCAN